MSYTPEYLILNFPEYHFSCVDFPANDAHLPDTGGPRFYHVSG